VRVRGWRVCVEASGGKEEPVAVRGGAENWPFCDGKVNHVDALRGVAVCCDATRAARRGA
jgi:hypothetical protein